MLTFALTQPGCIMPTPAQKQAKQPRPGEALPCAGLPGRLAVVYSYHSEINLGGLELLHPGDAHRQGRIFNALVDAGLVSPSQVFVPEPATDQQLLAVHSRGYLDSLKDASNVAAALEAPVIAALPGGLAESGVVAPLRYQVGGTVLAAELAMTHGLAINLGGGFQHAFRDHGEGFCLFADVPLAIHTLREKKLARRAMIVDLDIHHGNGFASYFLDDADAAVFDIYERDNYPAGKVRERFAWPIDHGISEADYLALLSRELPKAIDSFRPEVLFYVAGVDPLIGDRLGHARVSSAGLVERDLFVIRQGRSRGLPTVMVLAGGYHPAGWQVTYRTIAALLTGIDPGSPAPGRSAPSKAGK